MSLICHYENYNNGKTPKAFASYFTHIEQNAKFVDNITFQPRLLGVLQMCEMSWERASSQLLAAVLNHLDHNFLCLTKQKEELPLLV